MPGQWQFYTLTLTYKKEERKITLNCLPLLAFFIYEKPWAKENLIKGK